MAQAFAERAGLNARAAGSAPELAVGAEVHEAMDDLGIDPRGRSPKGISEEDVRWADVVVTMGCGDACPVLPGKRYEDWALMDPIGLPVDEVRPIRDEIERRVRALA